MTGVDDHRVDDHRAIVDLTVDYCWAIDGCDWEALRDIFLPNATAELGSGTERGIDAIISRISGVLSVLDRSQHIVANHQVSIDGDRATSRCYLHAQHVRKTAVAGRNYVVAGRYEDDLVRTAEGWRIAHRRLVVMWTDGNPGVIRGD